MTADGEDMPGREQDDLLLRLRIAELERRVEEAWEQVAAQSTILDDIERTRWWRAGGPLRRARRAIRPDVRVASTGSKLPAGGVRVPLAGLHAETADGEPARWRDELVVDGVALPALLADPPQEVTFRIVPTPRLRFRAFAGLRPAAWVGNVGGVRFLVEVRDHDGNPLRSSALIADPGSVHEHRRWLGLDLDLSGLGSHPHEIVLRTELPEGESGAYAWAAWGDPVLLDAAEVDGSPSFAVALAEEVKGVVMRRRRRSVRAVPPVPGEPVISLLVPVHDPDPALLSALVDSVRGQSSPAWQLCICDDGSRDPEVRSRLRAAEAADERIVLTRHTAAQNISAATNAAFALATGDFVAPLDHDDVLAPTVIADVGAVLAADPRIDVAYTDNDKVLPDGRRLAPALKPGWAPEQLRAVMYTLHLGVYRRELVEQVGGWRSAFDGAQDHDLVLRLSERARRIAHVPGLGYHWRVHPGSAALSASAKPEAYDRGCHAVQEHLKRTGVSGRAERLPDPGRYRVVHEPLAAAVDIVLPLAEGTPDDVAAAVRELSGRAASVFAIAPATAGALGDAAAAAGAEVLRAHDAPWGALARVGIARGTAPFVVLLEELAVPETEDWLDELGGLAGEPAVAAAGALIVDPRGRAIHGGVALPRGVPLPVHPGAVTTGDDVAPELTFVTNRSALSGAVATRRDYVVGNAGPDPRVDRHALVQLTLALGARVGRLVHSPHARLRAVGRPRGVTADIGELAAIARARGHRPDPLYNPLLWPDRAAHIAPAALTR